MIKKLAALTVAMMSIATVILVMGYLSINEQAIRYAGEQKAIERVARARATTRFIDGFYDGLQVFVQVLMLLAALALAAVILYAVAFGVFVLYQRHWAKRHLPTDGVYPLLNQSIMLTDAAGNRVKAIATTNHNLLTAPVSVNVLDGVQAGTYQIQNSGLSESGMLNAKAIERQANNLLAADMFDNMGGRVRASVVGKILNPGRQNYSSHQSSDRLLAVGDDEEIKPVVEPMSLSQAFQKSTDKNWIVGRSNNGDAAMFDIEQHVHAAVLGATGTGKSAGVGMMLAGHALKNGHRLIVLDGKGGDDWSVFAKVSEYHFADSENFPAFCEQLFNEYRNRCVNGFAEHMSIVIEEYGDLNYTMGKKQRAIANGALMTIIRKGRSVGMHLIFIDQYPDRWEPQILQNTKAKFVYRLDDGTIVKEYHAHKLADRGEFFFRGVKYNSFHCAPHGGKIVEMSRSKRVPPLLSEPVESDDEQDIAPESRRIEIRTIEPVATAQSAATVQPSDIQKVVIDYVNEHPSLRTTPPQRGAGELDKIAERIKAAFGEGAGSRSYISETLKLIREGAF